jgi:hypothetical protein
VLKLESHPDRAVALAPAEDSDSRAVRCQSSTLPFSGVRNSGPAFGSLVAAV